MHITPIAGQCREMLWTGCGLALGLIAGTAVFVGPAAGGINAWTSSGPHGAPVTAVAVNAFGHVYAGTGGRGVYMSLDRGVTWDAMNVGLGNFYVQSLLVDRSVATTLYAALPGRGVFKSVDAGQTWLAASTGLPGRSAQHLAIDSASGTLFVSTDDGVFRSTDRADSWTPTALRTHEQRPDMPDVSLGAWIDCLTVDPTTSTLYACYFDWSTGPALDWTLLRSVDSGDTWDTVTLPGAGGPLAMAIDGQGTSYAVMFDPYVPASTVIESCDSGETWRPSAVRLDGCEINCRINALTIDATVAGVVYAATDRGVFARDADATSWRSLHAGMGDRAATAVAADGRFIYAATSDGVFAMEQARACTGDCDGDGAVSIAELVTLVQMVMEQSAIETCTAGDSDGDGAIDIADLVAAVRRAMDGCSEG